jgi:sulfate adenylyltransferase
MTAGAETKRVAAEESLPTLTLDTRQLGDLELMLSGAFAPLRGFMSRADVFAVATSATLADGAPWPIPVTLDVPADAVPAAAERLVLSDPEGTPLAVLTVAERGPADEPGLVRLAGPVAKNRRPEHGSFRRLMIAPEQAKAEFGGSPVLAFATRAPLGRRHIGQLKHLAGQFKAKLLILPLVAGPAEVVNQPEALIRAVLAAAGSMPAGTMVVPVPLAPRGSMAGAEGSGLSAAAGGSAGTESGAGSARELAVCAIVAAAYGATYLMADVASLPAGSPGSAGGSASPGSAGGQAWLPGAPIPVLASGDWAYDPRAEVWRPHSLIEAGAEIEDLSADQLGDMLDTGAEIPSWFASEAVLRELRHARPPRSERGFVLFLTGLSGSGKSTIARDLRDLLAEYGERRVSLLDGDLVRSLLSAGLTFSRADRDLNIARIGYVATEVARHGGIAICAPIAPYAAARERVRDMVSQVGDFLLIHVATPVEVCEARDRKGLYAKARAGLIDNFTGVNDPYEEPTDAMLVIDTSVVGREQATGAIMKMLTAGGWLPEY